MVQAHVMLDQQNRGSFMKIIMTTALLAVSLNSAVAAECSLSVEIATQRTNGTFFQNMNHPDFPATVKLNTPHWESCYKRALSFAKANMIGGTTRVQLASTAFGRTLSYGQPYIYWTFKTGFLSSINGALTEYSSQKPKSGDRRLSEHGDPLLGKVRFFSGM